MVSLVLSTVMIASQPSLLGRAGDQADWEVWKQERIRSLQAPTGWLSVSALHKITNGYTTLGSSSASELRLREGSVGSQAGTIIRQGSQFYFKAHPSTSAVYAGEAVDTMLLSSPDLARTPALTLGDVTLSVIQRGKDHFIRVWDPGNARKRSFPGIPTFSYQPSWRITAKFIRFAQPKDIPVTNILGITEPTPHIGKVLFTVGGTNFSLTVQDGGDRVSIMFADRSNRTTTHGSGRFLVSEPIKGDQVILDFNKSYSPPCAFTDFATCPLPIPENKLSIPIEAGEKRIKNWKGTHLQ